MDVQNPAPPPADPRFDFMGNYIIKIMKVKVDKWIRVVTTDETLNTLKEFVDQPLPLLLVVVLTSANQLLPVTTFPCYMRNKAIYFVKNRVDAVPKENFVDMLNYGECSYFFSVGYGWVIYSHRHHIIINAGFNQYLGSLFRVHLKHIAVCITNR